MVVIVEGGNVLVFADRGGNVLVAGGPTAFGLRSQTHYKILIK